ncbi:MAG: NfeD family protein [Eubacteriales bacterium]|nr:NfeD family protein [Eubacteriales bacterium]
MNLSVTEIAFILSLLAKIIAGLLVMLLAISASTRLLGRLTRVKTDQTDFDLIGHEAKVIRAIRPPHAGRIAGKHEGQAFFLSATSSERIKVGSLVLITAIDNGVARTVAAVPGDAPPEGEMKP